MTTMFVRDLRYGAKTLSSHPALTGVAVLSLAIGLAAVTGATSILDAAGFRAPAVASPEALVRVQTSQRRARPGSVSWADFQDMERGTQSLAALAAFGIRGAGLSGPEAPPEVVMLTVTSINYFSTLGVTPAIGRAYGRDDVAAGTAPVLISTALWRRRFNSDAGILGRSVILNGRSSVVVGVLPPAFTGLLPHLAPDVWTPYETWRASLPSPAARDDRWLTVVGRLAKAGGSDEVSRAEAELNVIAAGLATAYPGTNVEQTAVVVPELTARSGGLVTLAFLLWMVVGLVLLVGCANVAGLLLGRAEQRRREMAIRVALGASRRRLIRQLLTENLLLAGLGCGAGLLLGYWLVGSLHRLLPSLAMPLGLTFPFDLRVMAVTIAVAVITVLLFGLGPAFTSARAGIAYAARTPTGDGRGRHWSARHILVIAQVAVSFVLVLSGGVFVRALQHAQDIDPGFQVRPMLLVTLAPTAVGYNRARAQQFFRDLVAGISAQPGILDAGLARRIPLDANGGGATRQIVPPDGRLSPDGAPVLIRYNSVSANYFSMMGTTLRSGRIFTDSDTATSPPMVIINETMARQHWPGRDAVGQTLRVVDLGDTTVAGVVQDGKYIGLYEDPMPYLFFSLSQVPASELTLMVRTAGGPSTSAPMVRDVLRRLDPAMPSMQITTLETHASFGTYEPRVASIVIGYLAGAGLVLSLVGLVGVVAFVVARRTREIGIRMALGARPSDIFRSVLSRALTLASAGVAAGTVLGWLVTRGMGQKVYGVNPAEPLAFLATGLVLILVAALASLWPARRAMRVDPVHALRSE